MRETSSGAFAVNEAVFQAASSDLPFGGVGMSGYGKYHGFDGFKALSNNKAVLQKPALNVFPYTQLFPPFTQSKQNLIKRLVPLLHGTQAQIGKKLLTLLILGLLGYNFWKGNLAVFAFILKDLKKSVKKHMGRGAKL
jgi:hypothetical protein